jgi:hypothetical protein
MVGRALPESIAGAHQGFAGVGSERYFAFDDDAIINRRRGVLEAWRIRCGGREHGDAETAAAWRGNMLQGSSGVATGARQTSKTVTPPVSRAARNLSSEMLPSPPVWLVTMQRTAVIFCSFYLFKLPDASDQTELFYARMPLPTWPDMAGRRWRAHDSLTQALV